MRRSTETWGSLTGSDMGASKSAPFGERGGRGWGCLDICAAGWLIWRKLFLNPFDESLDTFRIEVG